MLLMSLVAVVLLSACEIWNWQDPASDGDQSVSDGDKDTVETDKTETSDTETEADGDHGDGDADRDDAPSDGDMSEGDKTDITETETEVDGDPDVDESATDGDKADADVEGADKDPGADGDHGDGDTDRDDTPSDGDADDAPTDGDSDGDLDLDTPTDGDLSEEAPADGDMEKSEEEENVEDLICSNGICTDPVTGFEWQQTPTGGEMTWDNAIAHCQSLNLGGTGWRLPNISELRSLVRNCADIETGGACGVKDVCSPCGVSSGDKCISDSTSCFLGPTCNPSCEDNGGPTGCYWPQQLSGNCGWYWSSSSVEGSISEAWYVHFTYGRVYNDHSSFNSLSVRCVRDQCIPTSHASYACDSGDVYWYDSCGNREEPKEECGTEACSIGACQSLSCINGICNSQKDNYCINDNLLCQCDEDIEKKQLLTACKTVIQEATLTWINVSFTRIRTAAQNITSACATTTTTARGIARIPSRSTNSPSTIHGTYLYSYR